MSGNCHAGRVDDERLFLWRHLGFPYKRAGYAAANFRWLFAFLYYLCRMKQRLLPYFVHPFVWLRRIGHRRGYGVHSPFAYNFITRVIYERASYYKYADLRAEEKRRAGKESADWLYEPLKVKRLLFRVVNYVRPRTIIDAGRFSASSLYLKAGCLKSGYVGVCEPGDLFLDASTPVDFLYIHDYRNPAFASEMFERCVSHACDASVFVVEGIGYTSHMRQLWKHMRQDERVAVTFDLYDLGILFFDKKMNKQDYVVFF